MREAGHNPGNTIANRIWTMYNDNNQHAAPLGDRREEGRKK
jgi:hypothetical protein